jgi:hypothetical protein
MFQKEKKKKRIKWLEGMLTKSCNKICGFAQTKVNIKFLEIIIIIEKPKYRDTERQKKKDNQYNENDKYKKEYKQTDKPIKVSIKCMEISPNK